MLKQKKQIRTLLVIFVILILLVAAFLFFILRCDSPDACQSGSANENAEYILDDVSGDVGTAAEPVKYSGNPEENLAGAAADLSGANLVSTGGLVINDAGLPVNNEAAPMTDSAPRLSAPLDKAALPDSIVKLEATKDGFRPSGFTVVAGQAVTLALTSSGVDSRLVFDDASLMALELPVPSGFTMAKTFNAPTTPGNYRFHQDIPGRNGEQGIMIVK
jgi:plastocyanin